MADQGNVNVVQLQKYLTGVDYPTGKDDLAETACRRGADNKVVSPLQRLPANRFNSPNDVSEAMGKAS